MKRRSAAALLLTLGLTVGGNGMVLAAEQEVAVPAEKVQEADTAEKADMTADEASEESGKADDTAVAKTGDAVAADTGGYVSRIVSFTDYTGMRVTYDANLSHYYVYEVKDAVLVGVKCRKTDENGAESLEDITFEGNVELKQPEEGERYTSVAADVFSGNQLITYVKLPAGVTTVAEGSFKGCTTLKSVYLPSTVNGIGASAFENCTDMTQISLSKSVTTIGKNAFKGDAKLQTVQIRDVAESELTSVGAHAFAGCRSLQQITIPQAVALGEDAFEDDTTVEVEEQVQ